MSSTSIHLISHPQSTGPRSIDQSSRLPAKVAYPVHSAKLSSQASVISHQHTNSKHPPNSPSCAHRLVLSIASQLLVALDNSLRCAPSSCEIVGQPAPHSCPQWSVCRSGCGISESLTLSDFLGSQVPRCLFPHRVKTSNWHSSTSLLAFRVCETSVVSFSRSG